MNASTGRERWATKTVHGTRRFASATLAEFIEDAGYARLRSGTVADLLDRWMGQASPAWSSTTVVQTRSVVEHHLKPQLGHLRVNKLTTTDIDAQVNLPRAQLANFGERHHAYLDGPVGPVLRATKIHRTYRVAVDAESMQRLVDHYRRAVERGSGAVSGQAFVFTADADGGAPSLPNRVTKNFIGHRRRAGVGEFRLHDYADTSPQLRCSPMVLPWSPSRNDLATPERRPP